MKKKKSGVKGLRKPRVGGSAVMRTVSTTKAIALPAASGLVRDVKPSDHINWDSGEDTFGGVDLLVGQTSHQVVCVYNLNPDYWDGSICKRITAPFQQYRFRKLMFSFIPQTGISTPGSLKLIFVNDPDDVPNIGDPDTALVGLRFTSFPIYLSATLDVSRELTQNWLWLNPMPTDERRLTTPGWVAVVYEGPTITTAATLGDIVCTWDVQYRMPAPPGLQNSVTSPTRIAQYNVPFVLNDPKPIVYSLMKHISSLSGHPIESETINGYISTAIKLTLGGYALYNRFHSWARVALNLYNNVIHGTSKTGSPAVTYTGFKIGYYISAVGFRAQAEPSIEYQCVGDSYTTAATPINGYNRRTVYWPGSLDPTYVMGRVQSIFCKDAKDLDIQLIPVWWSDDPAAVGATGTVNYLCDTLEVDEPDGEFNPASPTLKTGTGYDSFVTSICFNPDQDTLVPKPIFPKPTDCFGTTIRSK